MEINKAKRTILIMCSSLGVENKKEAKRFTDLQWDSIQEKIKNSDLNSIEAFYDINKIQIDEYIDISEDYKNRIIKLFEREKELLKEVIKLKKIGINILVKSDENYPDDLINKLNKKTPNILYYCGDIEILKNRGIGIVGSRDIDKESLDFTKKIAQFAVEEDINIVSGGAKGVDLTSEKEALKGNGKVISIVANNLIKKVSENRKYIKNKNLLVISEVEPDEHFRIYNAMSRNKYIYILSNACIVVKSGYKKGGTWTGAEESLKNNWTKVFVREDKDTPKGNKELIMLGAEAINSGSIKSGKSLLELMEKKNYIKEKKEEQIEFEM